MLLYMYYLLPIVTHGWLIPVAEEFKYICITRYILAIIINISYNITNVDIEFTVIRRIEGKH